MNEWWKKPPEEMSREELVARATALEDINGLLKRENKLLVEENARLAMLVDRATAYPPFADASYPRGVV